jgi:hypothetical protein
MSFCAKYVPNTTSCCNIPPQDEYLYTIRQNLNSKLVPVTKEFALDADPCYYQLPDKTWSSCDPRLIDQVRGIKTSLSRPPFKVDVNCQLSNINYNGTITNYNNLANVNIGDYVYYYNKDLAQPFIPQNFSIPSEIKKEIFIDPMTSVKPQYYREKRIYSIGCDQPTKDQLTFREDMTERFLRKANQVNWEAFHGTK